MFRDLDEDIQIAGAERPGEIPAPGWGKKTAYVG